MHGRQAVHDRQAQCMAGRLRLAGRQDGRQPAGKCGKNMQLARLRLAGRMAGSRQERAARSTCS